MATPEDAEAGDARVGFREHVDNPIVFVILITLTVYALGAVGRHVGILTKSAGITGFFGG